MSNTCPICESNDTKIQSTYRGTHATFVGLQISHCHACKMICAAPMPSESDLHKYNASYFATAHGGQPRGGVASAFFFAIARLRRAHIDRYLAKHGAKVASLLEVGPGTGFFARTWLEKHPSTIYVAIETDTSCHALLGHLGVHLVDGDAAQNDGEPVDLVVMSHVLEHVSNPKQFLSNTTQNLRRGGALFIEVPCRDWEHKSMDEPHLLFFDKEPMKHLLGKIGFEDIEMSYHGQEIAKLRNPSKFNAKIIALRSRLIGLGVIAPFGRMRPGMEGLADPLERAVVAPFLAHREAATPAWWLRALARKK